MSFGQSNSRMYSGENDDDADLYRQWDDDDGDEIFQELENIDQDGHFHNGHHHVLRWYAPPVQRQRWGEDQVLPHVNWGDLLFDLFYVGMAYNLGVLIKSSMNDHDWLRGVIFFVGCFGPLWTTWEVSMKFESRFTKVDYFHRLVEVIRYFFLTLALVHVTPIGLMADPKLPNTLLFCLSVFGESLIPIAINLELYFKGNGDRESIMSHAYDNILYQLLPTTLVYLVASTMAFVNYKGADFHRRLAYGYSSAAAYDGSGSDRPLWLHSDMPLALTAGAYLLGFVFTAIRRKYFYGDIRKRFVPTNTNYEIHRYGEWMLLMIGEGILSLLIVEHNESAEYYIIILFGVLTMICIHELTFESSPHDTNDHALYRNFLNSMCFSLLYQVLSMALIVFGVTYKVFLKRLLKEAQMAASYSKDAGYSNGAYEAIAGNNGYDTNMDYEDPEYDNYAHDMYGNNVYNQYGHIRMLGGGTSETIYEHVTTDFYSGALLFVILSLELLTLTHGGMKSAIYDMFYTNENKIYWPIVFVNLMKVAVVAFTATLWLWTTDASIDALSGFFIVAAMASTRLLHFLFDCKRLHIEGHDQMPKTSPQRHKKEKKQGTTKVTESVQADKLSMTMSDGGEQVEIGESFDGIVVADLNGVITQVNEMARALFRYASKSEMIGKNLSVLLAGEDGGLTNEGYMKALKTQCMMRGCRADDSDFICVAGIKMIPQNKKIAAFIRDMTGLVLDEGSTKSTARAYPIASEVGAKTSGRLV